MVEVWEQLVQVLLGCRLIPPARTACEGTGVGRPRLCWLYLERRDGLRARGWRSVFSPHGWNKRWTSGLCFGGGLEERGRQARDPPCQGSISVHCPLQLWSVPWLNPPIQARLSASAKPCPLSVLCTGGRCFCQTLQSAGGAFLPPSVLATPHFS